jgi:flagellar biosynthetic protein FliQ
MGQDFIITLVNRAIYIALMISAPMLLAGLLIGLFISIFQAVTQINEITLTLIPKILVTIVVLLLFLPWMAATLLDFTSYLFGIFPEIAWESF